MKIYTCPPDSDCGGFQDALAFLKNRGVEPAIKQDEDGHCFEFEVPKEWDIEQKREFNNTFLEMTHDHDDEDLLVCDNCSSFYADKYAEVSCKECEEPFFLCEDCINHFDCNCANNMEAQLSLPIFKQGDDLSHFLQHAPSVWDALYGYGNLLRETANQVDAVANAIKDKPVHIDADTHFIGVSGPKEIIEPLVEKELLDRSLYEDEEEVEPDEGD